MNASPQSLCAAFNEGVVRFGPSSYGGGVPHLFLHVRFSQAIRGGGVWRPGIPRHGRVSENGPHSGTGHRLCDLEIPGNPMVFRSEPGQPAVSAAWLHRRRRGGPDRVCRAARPLEGAGDFRERSAARHGMGPGGRLPGRPADFRNSPGGPELFVHRLQRRRQGRGRGLFASRRGGGVDARGGGHTFLLPLLLGVWLLEKARPLPRTSRPACNASRCTPPSGLISCAPSGRG